MGEGEGVTQRERERERERILYYTRIKEREKGVSHCSKDCVVYCVAVGNQIAGNQG